MNIWVLIYRVGWGLIVALILAMVVALFLPQVRQYRELQKKEEALKEEVRLEEELLKHLREQQERLRSDPRFIEKIAREDLGLAKPDETIFKFIDDDADTSRVYGTTGR